MPHVTLEFSKGIEQVHDVQAICDQLFACWLNIVNSTLKR
ncbi:hypothetical protein RUM4293_01009 [Ruegeria atlantica]|uniref:Uncharacterized protein n=1 Tax=Ruegeria atlantica TaxID=81569 RepID=A0A0P1EKV2_9RHOB|nr:hypothetical protein RUM4293_01009 [Ruegeria atlantica]